MSNAVHFARAVAPLLCAAAALGPADRAAAQAGAEPAYESSFVQVRGIRMHYLDFGGPGLPVIFIHGSHANARSFVDFAPRFADSFRVLALDRRGHGESENVDWGHGTVAQAEDILGFMDALGLQRAVLIDGNVGLTTYLGEHHPDRLEGIVFLRHMAPEVESRRDSSTAEFWDMASRTACDWDEETRQRNTQRDGYRPHFIDDPDVRIDVPALSLANADGTRLPEDFDAVGIFLEQVETGEWCDTTAKAYFSALAADTARATELRNRLGDLTGAANLSAFERAFGPRMTVVRLRVPAVTGYEYLRAPDLIYPHIRRFLETLDRDNEIDADTVRVAPPTGVPDTDRASILGALQQVRPGGTVRFAAGTYLVGELLRVETPRLTLLGHPEGTILRGCEPEAYDAMEWQFVQEVETLGPADRWRLLGQCGTLALTGGQVTVRDLAFEYSRLGLVLGCCDGEEVLRSSAGGYRIEDNTFRNTGNSIRAVLSSPEPTVIRGNRFVNTFHAFSGAVSGVHILDNDISVPEPGRVPGTGHPGFAIGIRALPPEARDTIVAGMNVCEENVIAGNRIDGHPDGILLSARQPGTSCRENVIRENTIQVRRVRFPVPWLYADLSPLPNPEDSTFVGVPLALSASAAPPDAAEEHNAPARVEDNRVEDNQIVGAEGLGIAISHASRNRVANNTIAGVERREPFPGNMVGWFSTEWGEANGSGIWVSPGSDGNMIAGNTFEDIAAGAVVLEGDRNQVELQSTDDAVRDMGTGNRVTRAAGGARESDAAVGQAPKAATAQEWTDPSPHEVLYVTVSPDVRLEVLDWGGDGLPLVFLAGANFNAHSFDEFAPRFTDTHRVLGITRRGHGASSWPDSGYDLPTLVEDIRVVLDSLGIDRAILAGHSMAGSEMTSFATESPDRVAGLIYIDAGHDPTDIGRLRVPELCSFSPAFLEAMERTFENPELVRRTQRHTGEDGARRPFASASAVARIHASLPSPDYSGVQAPALGIYYVPERTEDVFMGVDEPPAACVAAFHRYIHGGIAAFTEGVEQATVIALSDTNHNIHLASPAALEAVMRQWLDSHAAPDPIDPLVREHMEELGIPAVSLVVMRHGVVLREAAYGRPSLELDVPATPATVFPYASMAKVFTGTAVLRLVQDGRLSLDGRVADVLPGLPAAWGDVTIRQLLGHTSGLPDLNRERGFRNPFVAPWASRAAALEALAEQPVERSPGTGYSYNQTNYLLLGMLLERVDGRTVEEYVAEEIAGPLGLASLAYGDSRIPIAGRASWYSRLDFSDGGPRVVAPRPLWIEYPTFLHTAAGLNGTARDLARFVAALASGSLLDDAHRHEMWTAVPLADGTTFRFEDGVTGAGLGWWVHDDPTHPWVGMGGGASGVVRHYVNEGLTIAVLTNLQGAEPEAIVNGIADIYLRAAVTREGNGALEPK